MKKQSDSNFSRGFTLIELVVVLALFLLIMGVAVSIFISIVQHQKSILSRQEMLNQTSYVQDTFSRRLRTAVVDSSGSCLVDGNVHYQGGVYLLTHFDLGSGFYQGVKFLAADGACQEFFLGGDGVLKESKNGALPQALLSQKFTIVYARFIINADKNLRGARPDGQVQPRITFALSVQDATQKNTAPLVVQTTISQR